MLTILIAYIELEGVVYMITWLALDKDSKHREDKSIHNEENAVCDCL